MAARSGRSKPNPQRARSASSRAGAPEPSGRVPELVRRALGLGLSGLFLTEETLRRALGDALPRDWIDFASQQSERARSEFLERLAGELARSFETVDFAAIAERLLERYGIEIEAKIRFVKRGAARREAGGIELRLASARRRR